MNTRRFPKGVRLSRRSEIATIFQRGTYRGLGLVSIKYQRSEAPESRFLIAVRKRVGHAPFRNRLRRWMREAIRHQRHLLARPFDICFMITQKPQRPVDYSYIENSVRQAFRLLNAQTAEL